MIKIFTLAFIFKYFNDKTLNVTFTYFQGLCVSAWYTIISSLSLCLQGTVGELTEHLLGITYCPELAEKYTAYIARCLIIFIFPASFLSFGGRVRLVNLKQCIIQWIVWMTKTWSSTRYLTGRLLPNTLISVSAPAFFMTFSVICKDLFAKIYWATLLESTFFLN